MATTKKPKKRISAKTMCRKTVGQPGINKRTGQLLKGWKYVKGVPTKVTATKSKKRGLGAATCVRPNRDGSTTTYSSHGGTNPCPFGGRIRAERVSSLQPAGTTYGLGKPKTKATAKQLAARKAFAANQKKATALVKSGKARDMKAAWRMIK